MNARIDFSAATDALHSSALARVTAPALVSAPEPLPLPLPSPAPAPSVDHPAAYETLMQFLYRAPIGLVQTTLDGTVEMINPMSASLLMPLSRNGDLDNLFVALELVVPQLRGLAEAYDQPSGPICESVRIHLASTSEDPETAPRVLSISLVKLDEMRLMAMVSDATLEVEREQSGLARRLEAAARTDALTQMPNRRMVLDLIERALRGPSNGPNEPNGEFAVLFMNCDRFKQVNDSLGHVAGDEVLGLMADRLRATLRQRNRNSRQGAAESVAGRLGGDEFVVLLHEPRSADEVRAVAQRLLDSLGRPYGVRGHQLQFSLSMGVVLRDRDMAPTDADNVLQDASIAMVEAKRAGGGRYVLFEHAMHERASRRGAIEIDLRRALVEQQLFVVYQPVVALHTNNADSAPGHAAGVEALVRWRHPTRGVVPPIEFIGVAEECGLIGALGEFVLGAACRQFVDWQQKLGPLAPRLLAVNLSRGQLGDPELAGCVGAILHRSGMDPACLQLEVTESLAAQDETVQHRLHELKALGLSLALDDFGTGYSSLASLHQLPVDLVKIDRSFVSEAVSSAHHRVLIEATVRVATSLGMGTVAEGIETAEQADLVRDLGCQKGQGYFFSRPLPPEDVVTWLASRNG